MACVVIHTLSLHDALPICAEPGGPGCRARGSGPLAQARRALRGARVHHAALRSPARAVPLLFSAPVAGHRRSEEHTSELQSLRQLVCRLLLEKKKLSQDKA